MFRPTAPAARRGNTLIVTLLLLTLLTILGLAALSSATNLAEITRIQGTHAFGDADATVATAQDSGVGAFNTFLTRLIYGSPDEKEGLLDTMRGHDLARTMYGGTIRKETDPNGNVFYGFTIPFAGVGTFNEAAGTAGVERRLLVNHRLFPGMTKMTDPEYKGERDVPTTTASIRPTGTYMPKSAPYTYPDIKDLAIAAQCPATGEIIMPSFYRSTTFAAFSDTTGLEPDNENWTNDKGKYLILRPRPKDMGLGFPYPPPNADGSVTGDVQNFYGAYLYNSPGAGGAGQKNDSIWIDIGMRAQTLPNGRRVKALVAPLILELNSRLNANIHGNQLAGGGLHASGQGFGPWEVNLSKVLNANSPNAAITDGQALVKHRGLPQTYSKQTTKSFYNRYPTGTVLPQYSQVAWNGFTAPGPLEWPGKNGSANLYTGTPIYTGGYDSTNLAVTNHSGLYNPGEYVSAPLNSGATSPVNDRSYPLTDTKLALYKYAHPLSFYAQMDFGTTNVQPAPESELKYLKGQISVQSADWPPKFNTRNPIRTDSAHPNRQLFTSHSYGIDWNGCMPTRDDITAGKSFSANANLGPIDLNRPLADYRLNTSAPLSSANMTLPVQVPNSVSTATAQQAAIDRQSFARDIFARLIVATGATGATVDSLGNVTIASPIQAPLETEEYRKLRNLAQLAANTVDYIDNDDVSTVFVWNPQAPTDPHAAANFGTPADINQRVVFGTEKPRLVMNEVYIEAVNDPTASPFPNDKVHVRVWVELTNPTPVPYSGTGGATNPLGDGSVKVYDATVPYQLWVARSEKQGPGTKLSDGLRMRTPNDPTNPPTAYPSNVTGTFTLDGVTAVNPDLIFDFSPANGTPQATLAASANATTPGASVVFGADVPNKKGPEFDPDTTLIPNLVKAAAPGGMGNPSLTYDTLKLNEVLDNNTGNYSLKPNMSQQIVMLRRLANPYQIASNSNPYITIDCLDYIPTADRILRGSQTMATDRPVKPALGGYDPNSGGTQELRPSSYGKVQPYAAYTDTAASNTFPQTMVLKQKPTTADGTGILHTFGVPNSVTKAAPTTQTYSAPSTLLGNETLMTPFDWLIHMDRPLINQLELLHVSFGKPHELTFQFLVPSGGNPAGVQKYTGVAPWTKTRAEAAPLLTTSLYRAFDLLRVQPFGHMTALGGRVPGKINLNGVQDRRIIDALYDVQTGNSFTQTDQAWSTIVGGQGSRTSGIAAEKKDPTNTTNFPCPIPRASAYDNNRNSGDRPFMPFGIPEVDPGSNTVTTPFNGGTGLQDTILRRGNGSAPTIFNSTFGGPASADYQPYMEAEPARKVLNNVTTNSQCFAVWVTVGYFEVTDEGNNPLPAGWPSDVPPPVKLGREAYVLVPGDMRQKFFAIIDRSNIALDVASFETYKSDQTNPPTHATVRPFFTTVEPLDSTTNVFTTPANSTTLKFTASADAGGGNVQVYADGVPVSVGANTKLAIGIGANQEIVTVSTVTFNAGVATATVTGMTKNHYPGECVSNVIPGNPGPQASFDVNLDMYKPVVPHWSKVP